ncbi:uncharacterized protein LOC135161382 isoform X2 [Diachasmimorpha longicaudata]|uniref:uncharacterized protein LOC135161382 isoform X2 n=2 Tax=Diachasmimorpha longicaudata TaxID=58733 RepID=UPI0030B8F8CB
MRRRREPLAFMLPRIVLQCGELIDSPGGYPAATATSPRNEKDALVGNTVETGAIYGSQGCKMIIGASLRGEDTRDCRPGHKLPGPLLAGCKCYTMRENVKASILKLTTHPHCQKHENPMFLVRKHDTSSII